MTQAGDERDVGLAGTSEVQNIQTRLSAERGEELVQTIAMAGVGWPGGFPGIRRGMRNCRTTGGRSTSGGTAENRLQPVLKQICSPTPVNGRFLSFVASAGGKRR